MKKWHRRGIFISIGVVLLGAASYSVFSALDSNVQFYISPSEVKAGKAPPDKNFRLGGMVKIGSVKRNNLEVNFVLTDMASDVPTKFVGILPDLFKENSGAVALGKLENGVFVAKEVLAKHDENYTPPPVQHALDKAAEKNKNY